MDTTTRMLPVPAEILEAFLPSFSTGSERKLCPTRDNSEASIYRAPKKDVAKIDSSEVVFYRGRVTGNRSFRNGDTHCDVYVVATHKGVAVHRGSRAAVVPKGGDKAQIVIDTEHALAADMADHIAEMVSAVKESLAQTKFDRSPAGKVSSCERRLAEIEKEIAVLRAEHSKVFKRRGEWFIKAHKAAQKKVAA